MQSLVYSPLIAINSLSRFRCGVIRPKNRRAKAQMISKIEPAATISEKIALIDTMTQKHREALQLLNDLRITLIIEDAKGKRNDT